MAHAVGVAEVGVGVGEAGVEGGQPSEVGVPAAAAVDFSVFLAVRVVSAVDLVAVAGAFGFEFGGGYW
ncbi:hypothetical protein QT196_38815 (plasmid) [Streptomyces sp. P9-2B-2]|uniref:hypothetical protein n=1 Tax=Streptomyces sp. P9-2B-2 TaxID=3057114 RepID=UPI0025B28CD4|nr:hypothetical protein [Streptomyces sp. P9-2B-2]WJY43216.1 hypothetical protein QT196_38815 [Streptomyces sp. P9-2B-2]